MYIGLTPILGLGEPSNANKRAGFGAARLGGKHETQINSAIRSGGTWPCIGFLC